ncbi:purine nucleoside permease [Pseudoalteromonas sp. MMG010]|uniref:purine-nucleoside phosphorylase n=1 Tax=Pseudoalteromonas sp. MMG010 TaxID=2822685 RepID=UPI001B3A1A56|nr:purine nucleoside permease [Pseudoalteromonas sp. MMG010]MBQ4833727.1 purine nucleoside permease [Pseudoalteromonas sp. MMG010]
MRTLHLSLLLLLLFSFNAFASEDKIKVKVFIAGMFEIGENQGDKPGEFQFWYLNYFRHASPIKVKGAAGSVFCNNAGVCGSVLGMGKVASSSSMQAILLNDAFDFSNTYFILSGVGGTPPAKGTIADVSWGSWLIDYDLGHRWKPEEAPMGKPTFMPRSGYEKIRRYQLNPTLLSWALSLSQNIQLKDSVSAQKYRQRYTEKNARRSPAVTYGTHMTGDTFFHGPGLSAEAQYIAELYGADDYVMTEMEAAAITQVINRLHGTDKILSLRGAVNFDQGNPNETTLEHLDPAPGQTAGGFAETVQNIVLVGSAVVDHIVVNWFTWQHGVPNFPDSKTR